MRYWIAADLAAIPAVVIVAHLSMVHQEGR